MVRKVLDYLLYAGVGLLAISLLTYIILGLFGTFSAITLILGLICIIVYIVSHLAQIREFFSKRSTRYGTNAFFTALLIIGILVILNFVASRHDYRWDTTAGGQFSLAQQTVKVLKNLKKEVRVTAFFRKENQGQMRDLLQEYAYHSKKLKYEFVDPDQQPSIAKRYNITSYGTTVVECGPNEERIHKVSEQDLTNAIIKVTREKKKVVYFVEGHGEHDIDVELGGTEGAEGYAVAKKAILDQNYEVKKILLVSEQKVPDDCTVLVVAGPQTDLLENEKQMIREYLDRGGKALFLLDPPPRAGLNDLLEPYGIQVGDDVVLDFSGVGQLFGAGPAIPIAVDYANHPITKPFRRTITAFSMARSVSVDKDKEGIEAVELVKTSRNSWAESDVELLYRRRQANYDADKDKKGPITIAAIVTKEVAEDTSAMASDNDQKKKARLIVIGDSDFASNAWFHFQRNGDLFMNAISWLAEEEDLVAIRPKSPEDRRVNLTKAQSKMIFWLGVILFPLAIVGSGIVVYIKRR